MEDLRSILATNDEDEVLAARAELQKQGIVGQVVISESAAAETRFDAEVGVDAFFRYNLLVPLSDEARALALVPEPREQTEPPIEPAPEPESENPHPTRTGYDGDGFLWARLVLVCLFFAHLPRALLISFKMKASASRTLGVLFSFLSVPLCWVAFFFGISGWDDSSLGKLFFGIFLYSVVSSAVCALDVLLTKNRLIFGFLVGYVSIVAAVLLFMFFATRAG